VRTGGRLAPGAGLGEHFLVAFERCFLIGVLQGGGVELGHLEAEEIDLAGSRPCVSAEGGQRFVDGADAGTGTFERFAIDAAVGVQRPPLHGR